MTPERFAKLQHALDRRQPDLTVFMDAVNKTHNVSAIIRTADGVGIQRIHALSEGDAIRRHHMISGGAKHWVGITLHRSTKAAHASDKSRDYRELDYTKKVAIMVGAELVGLSDAAVAAADHHVVIPMHGLGTSLNVSVAVGAILLEAERQRLAAGLYERPRLTPEERETTLFEWSYPDIAERCRQLGRPYPKLTADGGLAANPLLDVSISTVSPEQ
jgi:tRNA (guanosine-2'-O-)-methyltransferase